MGRIILRERRVPTVSLSGSTAHAQSTIVYGVNLFTMPGMQCCLRKVVESPYCNYMLFTAYCLVNTFGTIALGVIG